MLPVQRIKEAESLVLNGLHRSLSVLVETGSGFNQSDSAATVSQKEVVMAERRIYCAVELRRMNLNCRDCVVRNSREERVEILMEGLSSGRFCNLWMCASK